MERETYPIATNLVDQCEPDTIFSPHRPSPAPRSTKRRGNRSPSATSQTFSSKSSFSSQGSLGSEDSEAQNRDVINVAGANAEMAADEWFFWVKFGDHLKTVKKKSCDPKFVWKSILVLPLRGSCSIPPSHGDECSRVAASHQTVNWSKLAWSRHHTNSFFLVREGGNKRRNPNGLEKSFSCELGWPATHFDSKLGEFHTAGNIEKSFKQNTFQTNGYFPGN